MNHVNSTRREKQCNLIPYCALVLLSGCALTNPFITESKVEEMSNNTGNWNEVTKESCIEQHNLSLCLDQAEKLRAAFNRKSIKISSESRNYRYSAIVLGTVGAALGVYYPSPDTVSAVGILGSASYAFSEETPWDETGAIYQKGQKLLTIAVNNATKAANDLQGIDAMQKRIDLIEFLNAKKESDTDGVRLNCFQEALAADEDVLEFLEGKIGQETDIYDKKRFLEIYRACPRRKLKSIRESLGDLSWLNQQSSSKPDPKDCEQFGVIDSQHCEKIMPDIKECLGTSETRLLNEERLKRLQDVILTSTGNQDQIGKLIRAYHACSKRTSFAWSDMARLRKEKEQIRSGIKGLLEVNFDLIDIHHVQHVELMKVESEIESVNRAAKRIEDAVSGKIPSWAAGAREKVSIWLGLRLLDIRYAVDGLLAEAMGKSESPEAIAKEIWANVQALTKIYQETEPNTSDSFQPSASTQ